MSQILVRSNGKVKTKYAHTRTLQIISKWIISAQRALNVILTPEMGSPYHGALAANRTRAN